MRAMADQPRVLLLFSDTGGGHRSATEAIIEALEHAHPRRFRIEMIDVLTEYAPLPFNRLPQAYPRMVRSPRAWGWGFHALDGHRRARALTTAAWPYVRGAARRLAPDRRADLVVCPRPAPPAFRHRRHRSRHRARPLVSPPGGSLLSPHAVGLRSRDRLWHAPGAFTDCGASRQPTFLPAARRYEPSARRAGLAARSPDGPSGRRGRGNGPALQDRPRDCRVWGALWPGDCHRPQHPPSRPPSGRSVGRAHFCLRL